MVAELLKFFFREQVLMNFFSFLQLKKQPKIRREVEVPSKCPRKPPARKK